MEEIRSIIFEIIRSPIVDFLKTHTIPVLVNITGIVVLISLKTFSRKSIEKRLKEKSSKESKFERIWKTLKALKKPLLILWHLGWFALILLWGLAGMIDSPGILGTDLIGSLKKYIASLIENQIKPLEPFIKNPGDIGAPIAPVLVNIIGIVVLISLKTFLRKPIEKHLKEEPSGESKFERILETLKDSKKPLLILWHLIWFALILLWGLAGMIALFELLQTLPEPFLTPEGDNEGNNKGAEPLLNLVISGATGLSIMIIYLLTVLSVLGKSLKDALKEWNPKVGGLDSEELIKIWNLARIAIFLIFGIIALSIPLKSVGTTAAIAAAAVTVTGLTFRTQLAGVAGWLTLITWKPFEEEDWVKIGSITGQVDNIALMSLTLKETRETESGTVHIPNSTVLDQTIIKYGSKTEVFQENRESGSRYSSESTDKTE